MSLTSKLADQLDWNLLRTFMAIVQEGSITSAANRLALTQPAVSSALRRLEERLEVRLVDRGNGIAFDITPEGEALYKHCISIYGNIAKIRKNLSSPEGELKGRINVIASHYLYVPEFYQYIRGFNALYPEVKIEIYKGSCEDVRHALVRKVATLGIMALKIRDEIIEQTAIKTQVFNYYTGSDEAGMRVEDMVFASYRAAELHGGLQALIAHHIAEKLPASTIKISDLQDMVGLILNAEMAGPLPIEFARHYGDKMVPIGQSEFKTDIPIYLTFGKETQFNFLEEKFCNYMRKAFAG